jgi:hypothetical protein
MYRLGDRIIFNYSTLLIPNTCATVTNVLRDSDNGDERDLYVVMVDWNEMRAGQTYTITNTNIVRYQNPPATATDPQPAPTGFIASDAPLDLGEDGPSDSEEALDEEEEDDVEEADESEESAESAWMDRVINGNSQKAVRQQLSQPVVESMWTNSSTDRIQYITTRSQFNPQPMPRPEPQIVYNEMRMPTDQEMVDFVTIGGIRPIGMLEVEGVFKPVYDASLFHSAGILGVPDYNPTLESRYYVMFTIERTPMKPCYDTRHGIIVFRSDRGTIFVNEYAQERAASVENYRDVMHIRWARRDNVNRWFERNGVPIPSLYPKKKLRRKYKEIPKIKEEKFYAGNKEYIC